MSFAQYFKYDATPAQASTQASEEIARPQSKTTACDPVDQTCLNSQLVSAYQGDPDKCPTLQPDFFQKAAASAGKACQGDKACKQVLQAVAQNNPGIDLLLKKNWNSSSEPVARITKYDHCKCQKVAAIGILTKLNESRSLTDQDDPLSIILDNELFSNECGMHDWNQLCGTIVLKNSPEDNQIQLDFRGSSQQEHASTYSRGRRLQEVAVTPGPCTGPITNYNLLNINVQASQSYGLTFYNTNAKSGCDGVIQLYNPTVNPTNSVRVYPMPADVYNWVATFQYTTYVQSILYIENADTPRVSFRMGDLTTNNYLDNPMCIGGQLIAGGWLECGRSGKYLALTSSDEFVFMEVMCYSQSFVHHNSLSSTLSSTFTTVPDYLCTTGTNCQAQNVLRTTLVIYNNIPVAAMTPCCVYSEPQTDPELKVIIPADLMIECVIITPSDQTTAVTDWQKQIQVWIVNSAGDKQLCGELPDYNLYTEVPCKKVGNQIIVIRPGSLMILAMAGASILSNCDCSISSLNPALISRVANPFASATTISTTSTGAPISIKFNLQMPDTVSSVCGNADGFTKCGPRSTLVFTDKMTGFQITFPYKGFELNADQSVLTLNPSKAAPTSVLSVTIKLANYQTVTYSQEITAIVQIVAVAVVTVPTIPNMALIATINQEAFLDLPKLDAQYIYVVVSRQKFEASVDGNRLKVFSQNETDAGTYYLDLVAIFQSSKVSFQVKVILDLPTSIDAKTQTNQLQKQVNTTNETAKTEEDKTESILISDEGSETLLETAACITEEANDISCITPQGFFFQIDAATGKTFSGHSKKKAPVVPSKLPKLSIQKVNTKGQFYIKFSEPVGLEVLIIPTSQSRKLLEERVPEERRLDAGGAGSSGRSDPTQLYLLSAKHLKLTIKSENTTAAVFSWHASNITSTQIRIQLEFQDPLFISTSAGVLDKLIIQILPPALKYMRSLATEAMTEDPLRTVSRELPPQVILGAAVETVMASSDILKDFGQSSSVTNIAVQIVLSGSMTQMWSMVNAQQIIMNQQLLNLQMPGNVILVTTKLSDISSFEGVLPTEDILEGLFDFTPTDPPGVGFECMGVDNASVTLYQGITFIIMILIGLVYLVYGLAYSCRLYDRLMSKLEQKLKPGLCFRLFYLFLQETYLDWAIGSLLRLEQPKFVSPSDYFDFGLGCAGILITLVFPCYCFFFLKKNVNKLDNKDFKFKHGALYEGFTTDNAEKRSAGMKMAGWFLLRRFLTAINVVYLRHQTIWIQLTLNMWLTLFDVCVKIHLSPYKSKLGGFMEKFNDLFVLTCAYFPYLFTDLIPSPEDKYFIGWLYDGTVGTMIAANLFVMVKTAFHGTIKKIREIILKDKIRKATEARNANRKKQEKMMVLQSSGTSFISVKPRATQFQNGLNAIHELSFEQFVAIKRMQSKQRRQEFLAKKLVREMDAQLAEIPEVDENSENGWSNRAVQNDLEAQIRKASSKVPQTSHVVSQMVAQLYDKKQTDVNQAAAKLLLEREKFELDKKEQKKQELIKKERRISVVKQKLLSHKEKFLRLREELKQQAWDLETEQWKNSFKQKAYEEQKKIDQAKQDEIKRKEFMRNQLINKKDEEFNDQWEKIKKQNAIERWIFQEERKEIKKSYMQSEAQMLSLNQSERFKYKNTEKSDWAMDSKRAEFLLEMQVLPKENRVEESETQM